MSLKKQSLYIAPRIWGFAEFLSLRIRKKIYKKVMHIIRPNKDMKVLDIGVTCDQSTDSNFFEKLYPYKEKITAVGTEEARFLEEEYKGLVFIKANALDLPFKNLEFDFAFCSAVVEHVGDFGNQIKLVAEACRVAKMVVITTPNRFYPIEFHTLTPLLHWLPKPIFRKFLQITGRTFFSKEKNLNLLSEKELKNIIINLDLRYKEINQKFLGLKSNLVFIVYK